MKQAAQPYRDQKHCWLDIHQQGEITSNQEKCLLTLNSNTLCQKEAGDLLNSSEVNTFCCLTDL